MGGGTFPLGSDRVVMVGGMVVDKQLDTVHDPLFSVSECVRMHLGSNFMGLQGASLQASGCIASTTVRPSVACMAG